MDIDTVKAGSVGKWPGIFERLGVEVGTGKHIPCPVCGGKDRFRFTDIDGKGTWYCNQCTPRAGDGFSLVQKVLGVDFVDACKIVGDIIGTVEPTKFQPEKTITPEILRKIFKASKKTTKGDIVSRYLMSRGLNLIPENIRTTLKCWEPETKQDHPAMLAVFHLSDGTAVTMHRTYLSKEAEKLGIDSPKKMFPTLKPMVGGAVRLFRPTAAGLIGLAEGIETAIAVTQATEVPCWAALSAQLMAVWEPTPEITRVVVYGDNDRNYTGQRAAYKIANRLVINHKLTVDVEIPDKPGTDFLDEIGG